MKKNIVLIVLIFFGSSILAQQAENYNKLGASLKLLLAEENPSSPLLTKQNGIVFLPVLIELNSKLPVSNSVTSILKIRTQIGEIATADVAINDIKRLSELPEINRIELPLLFRKADTTMRRITTADKVLNGTTPLDRTYSGKNSVIGIIDDGIDFTHPDFQDQNNKCRIISIWNMDKAGSPPAGFTYGKEFLPADLAIYANYFNSKQVNGTYMQQLFGSSFHGTPVTALAAGNNGIATGADIINVALTAFGDTLLRSDRILDGIKYIYGKAKALNKKCVINISLGIMEGGPHDGKTLVEKAIDLFCAEKNDILICTSAGNNGNTWKHWGGFPINRDSSFCFFQCVYGGSLYFSIPKQYTNNLSLSFTDSKQGNINNPNISKDSIIQQTVFVNIGSLINNPAPLVLETRFPNNSLSSLFTFAASHYNDDYDELVVKVTEYTSGSTGFDPHLYRFIWKGNGTVHCWFPFLNLHPQFIFNNNPLPNDSTFKMSDNDYTTVIPTHAFTVLSSGAYNIRNCYNNMKNEYVNAYQKCRTTYFTSHGPTLDGRIKPDIISPGENVFAASSRFETFYGHDFFLDSGRIAFSGTSASSPITAGIAALIWEKYPSFTRQQVKDLILNSANFDEFCSPWGSKPNNIAGFGKIDAFKALTSLSTDISAICNIPDICKIKMDTVISLQQNNSFTIFPNPADNIFYVKYKTNKNSTLKLFDNSGKLVLKKSLVPNIYPFTFEVVTSGLSNGLYFLNFVNEEFSTTKKIIISHK